MRGLKSENLLTFVDFLYFGEVNILQENLDPFLALAEELGLKGVTGADNSGNTVQVEADMKKALVKEENTKQQKKSVTNENLTTTDSETVVALKNNSINADIHELDEQIKSMMTKTDVKTANGREYMATCNSCGKQAACCNIQKHIEANHITGLTHSCNICGKTSRSRDGLRVHKHTYHKTMLQN